LVLPQFVPHTQIETGTPGAVAIRRWFTQVPVALTVRPASSVASTTI
jgi:hypothetical protein